MGKSGPPDPGRPHINAVMVGKIVGSKVIGAKGETVATIGDLVVDIDTGRIVYALLDSGGFLGFGGKLIPVPWESLGALPLEGRFFLNRSKEEMKKASAVDKDKLPDMGDAHWGSGILKEYGIPSGLEPGLAAYDDGYGYGYGGSYGYRTARKEDPYRAIFDPKTVETVAGRVIKADRFLEPRFDEESRLTLLLDNQDVVSVYLGPAWYVRGPAPGRQFRSGDRVRVTGSRAVRGGAHVLIALDVTRGNDVLRLRDKDGIPAWIGWRDTGK